ncbi:hypothetical protein ACJMK2_006130 [Sinanodonta woodiana]|uniref:Uncharacterized protein n=1 Tax=Sinanodonta woodiana TaxID=1069815 RepID=A0ABD3VTJ0_SINWO
MSDEDERSGLKIFGCRVKPARAGNILGSVWIIIGFSQTITGFATNCDANVEFPIFIGVHGLLNMIYGIGIMLFAGRGYKQFEFRLVFYLAWIAEGALCITGMAFYSSTVGYLKGCMKDCKTCSRDLITGSIVIESFIFFLYILVTFTAIGHEIKTKCMYCKLGDGSGERSHDTEPRAGSPFGGRETRRTDPNTGNRGLDIARRIAGRTSADQGTGPNTIHIHNLYVSGGSPTPVDF